MRSSNDTNHLDHIWVDRINCLVKGGPLSNLQVESFLVCESSLQDKMIRNPFSKRQVGVNKLFTLVRSCVWANEYSCKRDKYFITFTNYC